MRLLLLLTCQQMRLELLGDGFRAVIIDDGPPEHYRVATLIDDGPALPRIGP